MLMLANSFNRKAYDSRIIESKKCLKMIDKLMAVISIPNKNVLGINSYRNRTGFPTFSNVFRLFLT
jgi:hypothetical protein